VPAYQVSDFLSPFYIRELILTLHMLRGARNVVSGSMVDSSCS